MIKSFNKLVISYLSEVLVSNGFSLNLYTMDGNMYYEKRINGFRYEICLSILSKNQLTLSCYMPFKCEEIYTEGVWRVLDCRNRNELIALLQKEVLEFINQANEFINKNAIELNIKELYKQHSEEVQAKYGFKRKFINDIEQHGILAVYANEINTIKFYHDDGFARFSGLVLENDYSKKIDFIELIKANQEYFGLNYLKDLDYFSFRNADEFYQSLMLLLEFQRKYLDEKEYKFKQ